MSWKYFFGVNIILKFEKFQRKYCKQIIEKKKKNFFIKFVDTTFYLTF